MAAEKLKKPAKMCGYLEKRGKMTITGKWKKWWCVLEGQLLLYYRSRTQYLKLSPCYGSLNVALVKSIQPHIERQIHVITHSQLIVLRAPTKEKQQSWFLAFIDVLPKPNYDTPFEYNTSLILQQAVDRISERYKKCDCKTSSRFKHHTIERSNSNPKDTTQNTNNISSNLHDHRLRIQIRQASLSSIYKMDSNEKLCLSSKDIQNRMDFKIRRFYSVQSLGNCTDERIPLAKLNKKCFSCHCILIPRKPHENFRNDNNRSRSIEELRFRNESPTKSRTEEDTISNKVKRKQSFSFLRRVLSTRRKRKDENKNSDENIIDKEDEHFTVTRALQNYLKNETAEFTEIRKHPSNTGNNIINENEHTFGSSLQVETSEESQIIPESTKGFPIMKRLNRTLSFASEPICDKSPILPIKKKVNSANYSSKIAELNSNPYDSVGRNFKTERNSNVELDLLLVQLNLITQKNKIDESPEKNTNTNTNDDDEDPDYDFPIPHASLIDRTLVDRSLEDNKKCTRAENESLHEFGTENFLSYGITPDSLEAPWMLVDSKQMNRWSTPTDFMLDFNQSGSDNEFFLDSLDTRQ